MGMRISPRGKSSVYFGLFVYSENSCNMSRVSTYEHYTDQQLWAAFRLGNEEVYEYIFRSNYRELLRYGIKVCRDEAMAKDTIQELFCKLWEHRAQLGEVSVIKGYLRRSLRNNLLKEVVADQRHTSVEDVRGELGDGYSSIEQVVIEEETDLAVRQRMERAMTQLSQRQREAIQLRYLEGKGYEEISEIMGIKYQSLRNMVHRALETLRKQPILVLLLAFAQFFQIR